MTVEELAEVPFLLPAPAFVLVLDYYWREK